MCSDLIMCTGFAAFVYPIGIACLYYGSLLESINYFQTDPIRTKTWQIGIAFMTLGMISVLYFLCGCCFLYKVFLNRILREEWEPVLERDPDSSSSLKMRAAQPAGKRESPSWLNSQNGALNEEISMQELVLIERRTTSATDSSISLEKISTSKESCGYVSSASNLEYIDESPTETTRV